MMAFTAAWRWCWPCGSTSAKDNGQLPKPRLRHIRTERPRSPHRRGGDLPGRTHQPGADAAIQGLGRTHRTHQASAPLFRPVSTDCRGERRFISTIARRLDSLGALTRGQRQTGGQGLFNPRDNLESDFAKDSLVTWFRLLFAGKLASTSFADFQALTGLNLEGEGGGMVEDLPPIQRWLNRILALRISLQNAIFDEYLGLIEARIGVTTRFVEQRVRLAELAPCIFQALAAGEISLGVAQAYAVTGDTDRQARVFEQMKSAYYGNQPDNIRRAILNGTVKANDAKARFVGRDAYLAAGGRIEGDLFASEGDENWIDVELLEDLAAQKLEAAAAELAESQGLAFVTPVAATHVPYDTERQLHEYHATARPLTEAEQVRVEALEMENDTLVDQLESELVDGTEEAEAATARLEEIERELDDLDAARKVVDPEVRAQLGTFVYIGGDGAVRVHTRMFSEKPVVDPNAPVVVSPIGGADDVVEQGVKLSATLIDELATQRRQILVAHLASDPALALDLTIFLMAQDAVFANNYVRSHSTLKASPSQFPIFAFRDEGSLASQTIADQRQALDTSWAGHDTMSARFDAFRALDDEARGGWVAFVIAQTFEPTLNAGDGGRLCPFPPSRAASSYVCRWCLVSPQPFIYGLQNYPPFETIRGH